MNFNYPIILDGGLATELERSFGKDLSGRLWSAQCLDQDPDAIKAVHLSYFRAGATVATTASYQASVQGFLDAGYTRDRAVELMKRSVRIAHEAREEFGSGLVALSMGCYGAILANGAEYTGDYGNDVQIDDLFRFHRERLDIYLQESGIDMILFETIPSYLEAQAIRKLVETYPALPPIGVSFSCKSSSNVSDGTPLSTCVAVFEDVPAVFAVGVNCSKPRYILGLLNVLKKVQSDHDKAILLYPDGGEEWDAVERSWKPDTEIPLDVFGASMVEWITRELKNKKVLVGGCCGTGPAHIASIKEHLFQSGTDK